MSDLIPRARVWTNALLLPVVVLVSLLWRPSPPGRHARSTLPSTPAPAPAPEPSVPTPRRTTRARPYVPSPPIPPDYDRFCQVHNRHRARWRLTYEPTHAAPYHAHNRVVSDIVLAASDLEALDFALGEFAPPVHARPYLFHPDPLASSATNGG